MSTERALRAQLKAMGVDLRRSPLGVVAVGIARRLDGDPTDRDATGLSRELRMVLGELAQESDDAAASDFERWVRELSTPGDSAN